MGFNQRGFTLLEAIVALVLISTVGMVAFGWINRSLDTLARIQQAQSRDVVMRNALDWMDTVNPMLSPRGREEIGNLTISWESAETEARRDGYDSGGWSLYQLALYDTEVVVDASGQEPVRFVLRQVGYEQVREFTLPF
jgi:general secretion pathway protein I